MESPNPRLHPGLLFPVVPKVTLRNATAAKLSFAPKSVPQYNWRNERNPVPPHTYEPQFFPFPALARLAACLLWVFPLAAQGLSFRLFDVSGGVGETILAAQFLSPNCCTTI